MLAYSSPRPRSLFISVIHLSMKWTCATPTRLRHGNARFVRLRTLPGSVQPQPVYVVCVVFRAIRSPHHRPRSRPQVPFPTPRPLRMVSRIGQIRIVATTVTRARPARSSTTAPSALVRSAVPLFPNRDQLLGSGLGLERRRALRPHALPLLIQMMMMTIQTGRG